MKSTLSSSSLKKKTDCKRITNLFLIPVTAIAGDAVIQYMYPYVSLLLKCFTDSATHFLIASLSWNYVEIASVNKRIHLVATFMCGLLASVIDVDHFLAVGTFSLQAATSLSHRPVLHCTTLFTVVALLLAIISIRIHSIHLLKLSLIIVTASWTHHWRDGYRRGIWICPIGSIPPYSYLTYLIGLIVLPMILYFGFKFISDLVLKSNVERAAPVYLI